MNDSTTNSISMNTERNPYLNPSALPTGYPASAGKEIPFPPIAQAATIVPMGVKYIISGYVSDKGDPSIYEEYIDRQTSRHRDSDDSIHIYRERRRRRSEGGREGRRKIE